MEKKIYNVYYDKQTENGACISYVAIVETYEVYGLVRALTKILTCDTGKIVRVTYSRASRSSAECIKLWEKYGYRQKPGERVWMRHTRNQAA